MRASRQPQQIRPAVVVLTREESRRVDAYVQRCGSQKEAAARLGVGKGLLATASEDGGRMLIATKARLFAALDEAEARCCPTCGREVVA